MPLLRAGFRTANITELLLGIDNFHVALADDFPTGAGFDPLQFLDDFTVAAFLSFLNHILFSEAHFRGATVGTDDNLRLAGFYIN